MYINFKRIRKVLSPCYFLRFFALPALSNSNSPKMKCYDLPFSLKSESLLFLKIDYPYSEEEIEQKISSITKKEGAFLTIVNQSIPILNWFHKNGYSEIELIDVDVFNDLKHLLQKYGFQYSVTDLTNELINNSDIINPLFKNYVIEYIDRLMDVDSILDRLKIHGRDGLNPFEMFYLNRLSQGLVTH